MKELLKSLQDAMALVLSIRTLQTKKTRSAFDRKDLDFKKEVLPFYLERLTKTIEEFKNKKED